MAMEMREDMDCDCRPEEPLNKLCRHCRWVRMMDMKDQAEREAKGEVDEDE
jgi:hypothetical protein